MGAGSVGCYLGGLLSHRGHEVVLIGRERLQQEVTTHGLTLTDLDGRRLQVAPQRVSFDTDAQALKDVPLIFVATKSGQTAEVGRRLASVISPTAVVISMQNGLRNAQVLREQLRPSVLTAIVEFNVRTLGNGHFHQASTGQLVIESSTDDRVAEVAEDFRRCGLPVRRSAEMAALQWSKLILNLNNAISALAGVPTPTLLFDKEYRYVVRAVVREALTVMHAAKVRTSALGPVPVQWFPSILSLPTGVLRLILRAQLRVDPQARSSMWEDLSRNRLTEVDELNGEIVKLAERIGLDAPLNRRIVEVIHGIEKNRSGSPGYSASQLRTALGMP